MSLSSQPNVPSWPNFRPKSCEILVPRIVKVPLEIRYDSSSYLEGWDDCSVFGWFPCGGEVVFPAAVVAVDDALCVEYACGPYGVGVGVFAGHWLWMRMMVWLSRRTMIQAWVCQVVGM